MIQANVQRLLSLQRPNGHWSVKFDPNYPITEMQTGESLYALALAGLKPDHPAMRRGIVALLGRQQPFGGWFDINPYEQFRTPFRETQWALMALSSLYPNPKASSATAGMARSGRSPRRSAPIRPAHADPRPRANLGRARRRSRAADRSRSSAMNRPWCARPPAGRWDGSATSRRSRAWPDAWAMRPRSCAGPRPRRCGSMGNRFNGSHRPGETPAQVRLVAELSRALRSPDDRTRRGATRVFAAHFRELSQETALADPLLERLRRSRSGRRHAGDQGIVAVVVLAGRPGLEGSDRGPLIAGLAEPRHPWVRRNLIEALYIIGDENIRYLYKNWVPSLARAESRRRATEAQHATVNRLGAKYVAALETRQSAPARGRAHARCRSSSSGRCWVAGSATTWSRCFSTATRSPRSRPP